MDSVGRAALEGAALGALAGGVGAAVGAAGLSGAAAFAVSEGADFIGGFLYDIGVNGLSREEALINGLAGIGFGGAIGLLGRGLSRAARNVNLPLPRQLRRQCASFSADTLIATPDGDKPISEIEVGDVILAYSEATEEVDLYHVSATHTQRHDTTLDLTIDGETLHTTDEHPFYVIRNNQEQWVQAQHLHIGDSVLSGLGETGIVEDIIIIDQPQTMYNLTVALVATYMVGDGQWVVHNAYFDEDPILTPYVTDAMGIAWAYMQKATPELREFSLSKFVDVVTLFVEEPGDARTNAFFIVHEGLSKIAFNKELVSRWKTEWEVLRNSGGSDLKTLSVGIHEGLHTVHFGGALVHGGMTVDGGMNFTDSNELYRHFQDFYRVDKNRAIIEFLTERRTGEIIDEVMVGMEWSAKISKEQQERVVGWMQVLTQLKAHQKLKEPQAELWDQMIRGCKLK